VLIRNPESHSNNIESSNIINNLKLLQTKLFYIAMCIHRTLMDFVIALSHIISASLKLTEAQTPELLVGCYALGCINQMALFASNLWFLLLSVDLIQAIRNPFR